MKRFISTAIAIIMVVALLAGCAVTPPEELLADKQGGKIDVPIEGGLPFIPADPGGENMSHYVNLADDAVTAITDFSVELFKRGLKSGENVLIAPISVLCALGMAANGANGQTLAQMCEAFGIPLPELNAYLQALIGGATAEEKSKFGIANSVWFRDNPAFEISEEFLDICAEYYAATSHKTPFDQSTVAEINQWVSDNTDRMINNIINDIPEEAMMYLINAMVFDAEWERIYSESDVQEGIFTAENGAERTVDMMYSKEHAYISDDLATGFIKYYANRKYAFAAFLPNEGVSVDEYINSLSGGGYLKTVEEVQEGPVYAAIPKFKSEYKLTLNDILKDMGMLDAFDPSAADFRGIGTWTPGENIYISNVLHKCLIEVDERGTKAGAVTIIEFAMTSLQMEEPRVVTLDRPFVYMLIDCETGLPLFMGAIRDIGGLAPDIG